MPEQQVTPEAPIAEDVLWNQAQKDRVSTQADEAPAEQPAPQGGTVDPLAGLPEPTRKLIEQIQAKTLEQDVALKEAGQKLATAHGTIGNLSQKLDASLRTLTQMKPAVEAVQAEAKAKTDAVVAERETKRKERRERLADLPDILEELDDIRADAKPAEAPKQEVTPPKQEKPTQDADEVALMRNILQVDDIHPGWRKEVKTPEFQKWANAQPEAVRALAQSDDITDADKMLTLYKKHKTDAAEVARVETERQARLSRGEIVQGSGTAQTGTPSTDSLWEQAKRDRAKARAAA